MQMLGYGVSVLGFVLYSHLKLKAQREGKKGAELSSSNQGPKREKKSA